MILFFPYLKIFNMNIHKHEDETINGDLSVYMADTPSPSPIKLLFDW